MIMAARHHLWGSGCVPHRISMTRRWGPVGLMRVGGMGQMTPAPSGSGSGFNTPSGFVPVTSVLPFHAPTILPSPAPPLQSPYRYRGLDQVALNSPIVNGGLGQTPLNAAQASFQVPMTVSGPAVIGAGSPDPKTGISPADLSQASVLAAIAANEPLRAQFAATHDIRTPNPYAIELQWLSNLPGVYPAIPQPQMVNGQVVYVPAGQVMATTTTTAANVVNPSPSTQLTTTGSTTTAPGSVVSQANGTVAVPGTTASTVGGTVSTTDTSGQVVAGLPNWVLFVAGGVALVLLTRK